MTLIVTTAELARVYAAGWQSAGNPLSLVDSQKAADWAVDGFMAKLTSMNNGERPHVGDATSAWDYEPPLRGETYDVRRSGALERLPFAPRESTEHSG